MTSTRKSPLLEASKKYKRRKQDTEYNLMGSETEINTAIINEFDSTTQTDVNSISTRVGAETLNSDQTLDDIKSVCVKVEADEWCNVAACFYSGCADSEQVQGKEKCQETDTFHGRGKLEDVYIPCPVEIPIGGTKKEPVLDEKQDACDKVTDENRLRILNELPLSQFGSQEVFLDFEHDQFMPSVQHSSSDLTPVIHLSLKTEANTSSTSPSVQILPTNAITCRLVIAASSNSTDAWGKKMCFDKSIKQEVSKHQSIGLSSDVTDSMDQIVAILPVNDPHVPMPLISYDSKSNLSHNISESQSNKEPLSMSSKIEEVAMTSQVVNSNPVKESGDCSSDDFEEIFIERNEGKSKSYPSTLPVPKRVCGEGSSRGLVKSRGTVRENAAQTTVSLFRKPAERKLDKYGDLVSNKKLKKAKTPEKDHTENSIQEGNQASCMNLKPPDDDHFLYCVECNKEFEGDCPVHGPYNYIQDKEVPEEDPHRAEHTLPDDLEIKTSTIVGAGLGVFTKVGLDNGIMYGPYEGDIITDNNKSGYCWQIYKESKASHYVDAQDKSTSNWMRYVNCAMKEANQNLVAFQYKGGIYYCTLKQVSSGEELLVWYGDECASELGLAREDCLSRDKNLHFRPKYVNGEEIFQCVYCKIAFATAVLFVRHLRRMHGGDKLTSKDLQVLDQWHREYDDQYLKAYAQQIHPLSNEIHLNSISNVTRNKSDMSQSFCDEQLTSVILHKNSNVEVCNYTSNISYGMKTFKRIPTGKRLNKCEVCGYTCAHKFNLKIHMRIHTGEKLYKCEVCGYAFNQKAHLKTHMRIHTGEKPYKCEICGHSFTQRSTLKTHSTIHTGEKLIKCEVCGFGCNLRCHLKTHMTIHTGQKLYKCEMCGYAFNHKGNLKKHMMRHSAERLYKCQVCGKSFYNSDDLKRCMRIHTGEREYQCEVCGYAFKRSYALKRHMRIHTEERKYKCEVCGNAFSQKYSLNRHMKIHTGVGVQV
ncbi:hypothetical protein DPMN_152129 [Dreissena polymorpha]|uniref:Uncharacterized protein n=1 Tax=Dreissena polymorpha TaxID=45954 RepID=A0A9D4J743_DREPO|nr:hypothetical protein DPMN_152129 [Dreissena polymorpha]